MTDGIAVDVQVDERFAGAVDVDAIERLVDRTITTVAESEPAQLTIVVTGDATVRDLNREYLGRDEATDVLAFSQTEGASLPDVGRSRYLGDVVVSYERAVAQAREHEETEARELGRLVVHGTLHLLGYDDRDDAGREEMWQLQESLLADWGFG